MDVFSIKLYGVIELCSLNYVQLNLCSLNNVENHLYIAVQVGLAVLFGLLEEEICSLYNVTCLVVVVSGIETNAECPHIGKSLIIGILKTPLDNALMIEYCIVTPCGNC